jgi:hypothetical protein
MRLTALSRAALVCASLSLAAPALAQAPSTSAPPVTAVTQAATGRSTRAARRVAKRKVAKIDPNAAIATYPGFKLLDDGTSRVFVEVNRSVAITETKTPTSVVYRIKGTVTPIRTNRLPLPTDFFRTPVSRIELKPDGDDMDLVIDLREATSVEHRVIDVEGGVLLQVDFGRSNVKAAPAAASITNAPAPEPTKRTTQTTKIGNGGTADDTGM